MKGDASLKCMHTFSQMCVYTHISGSASQALMLSVWDVFFGLGVYVFFGKPEVDDMNGVLPLGPRPPHQKILWLDISIYQAPCVNKLHPCYLKKQGRLWLRTFCTKKHLKKIYHKNMTELTDS